MVATDVKTVAIIVIIHLLFCKFAEMKKILATAMMALSTATGAWAERVEVVSPNGKLVVVVEDIDGRAFYKVEYGGEEMVGKSRLGLTANIGSFAEGLEYVNSATAAIDEEYTMRGTKASKVGYRANQLKTTYRNGDGKEMTVTINVADNDIALRYEFPTYGDTACMVVESELTAFNLPEGTTTFLTPQSDPMIGWMRTKPSYEEIYTPDAEMTARSQYGHGYTFPCLFHVGDKGWVLVSETGVDGRYVGSHLSDYNADGGYTIAFPMEGEANGWGSTTAGVALPGATPWRTLTVGSDLKPIVETTIPFDVVEPKYEASTDYKGGRYTWSWLIWQDESINYSDQVEFVDLAGEMGYEYVLVDNWWDSRIGRDSIEILSNYAREKGVSLLLWYNSNGYENDAPQTPKNRMNTSLARREEMEWLRSIGVKGIKVDFFAGDKQHTMQLYEDILADANDYGLQVVFHGCTLPRGWERMYPNYVASEAVLASENVSFTEYHTAREPFDLTLHPFCRNAVGAMDWGGTIMNRYLSKDNKSRHARQTTDLFEIASAISIQTSVQCIAMQPNNLEELSETELELLRQLPTTWDETRFIEGYPGKYVVMARRHGDRWYTVGLNATDETITISGEAIPAGETLYKEKAQKKSPWPEVVKTTYKQGDKIEILPHGGMVVL